MLKLRLSFPGVELIGFLILLPTTMRSNIFLLGQLQMTAELSATLCQVKLSLDNDSLFIFPCLVGICIYSVYINFYFHFHSKNENGLF